MRNYLPEKRLNHKTYELNIDTNFLDNPDSIPYKMSMKALDTDSLYNSPPIILCESRNIRTPTSNHRHYLFYPSTTRLSPYSDNIQIKFPQTQNDNNETQTQNKYQSLYNKTFELAKTISNYANDEKAKIKGDLDYYLDRNKEYDNIIEKQKSFLNDYFKKNKNAKLSSGKKIKSQNI